MFCLKTLLLVLFIKNDRREKCKMKMSVLGANTIMSTIQVNSRNMQKFSSLDYWLDIKIIVVFLLIPILKVLTVLMYAYFKNLLKLSRKKWYKY